MPVSGLQPLAPHAVAAPRMPSASHAIDEAPSQNGSLGVQSLQRSIWQPWFMQDVIPATFPSAPHIARASPLHTALPGSHSKHAAAAQPYAQLSVSVPAVPSPLHWNTADLLSSVLSQYIMSAVQNVGPSGASGTGTSGASVTGAGMGAPQAARTSEMMNVWCFMADSPLRKVPVTSGIRVRPAHRAA